MYLLPLPVALPRSDDDLVLDDLVRVAECDDGMGCCCPGIE
jgi:hypothetical protein